MVPPLTFFALSFLIDFFRGCREYAPIIRNIIEILAAYLRPGVIHSDKTSKKYLNYFRKP